MNKSESICELAQALADFQAEMPTVGQDASNPFYGSSYATLGHIIKTVSPILSKHGLSVSQVLDGRGGVSTILMHVSGEYVQGTVELTPEKDTPQGIGSAITYARRYSYASILGLVTDKDDDGNAATPSASPKSQEATAKPVGEGQEDKDDRHRIEVKDMVMRMADGDIAEAQELLVNWSQFEGKDKEGNPERIYIDSLKDPRLKGKWLNKIVSNGRKAFQEWLEKNPDELEKMGQELEMEVTEEEQQQIDDMKGAANA